MPSVMTYSEALDLVHQLAASNQIDANDIAFGDEGLVEQRNWQQTALDTVGDLVANHREQIDERHPAPQTPDDVEAPADRADDPTDPIKAIRIVLDLAEGAMLSEDRGVVLDDREPELKAEAGRQDLATALVRHLVVRQGDDLAASLTTFRPV